MDSTVLQTVLNFVVHIILFPLLMRFMEITKFIKLQAGRAHIHPRAIFYTSSSILLDENSRFFHTELRVRCLPHIYLYSLGAKFNPGHPHTEPPFTAFSHLVRCMRSMQARPILSVQITEEQVFLCCCWLTVHAGSETLLFLHF